MAEVAAPTVPSADLLEWHTKDKETSFTRCVLRRFYTEEFGMKLLRQRDIPEEKYSNAFLGFGPEETNFVVELTYNYGIDKYDIGTGFGHFAIVTPHVHKLVEQVKAKGGEVTREPGPVKRGSSVIAFVKDADGYQFELIQRGPTPEPLCQMMLRIGDWTALLSSMRRDEAAKKDRKTRVLDEQETTVLELAYNYGVTEYTKGNAYAQIAFSTEDVYKNAELINVVIQELGGKVTSQPGPIPGINTRITSFLDPDGWKTRSGRQ